MIGAPPQWLVVLAWIGIALGVGSALAIAADVAVLGRRQRMWIMDVVHPVTALYLGPVWLWAYATRWRAGRPAPRREGAQTALAVSHCGGGCTLGDIAGEWLVFALGWTIAGAAVWPELVVDFALAWTLGIAFQYFTIAPMRPELGRGGAVKAAIRADTLSILAFEVGLFGWMVLSALVLFDPALHPDSPVHWLMMQVGMALGFATAWPVNVWLLRKGWKERMGGESEDDAESRDEDAPLSRAQADGDRPPAGVGASAHARRSRR